MYVSSAMRCVCLQWGQSWSDVMGALVRSVVRPAGATEKTEAAVFVMEPS